MVVKLIIIALAYVGAMAQTGGDTQLLFAGGAPVCGYIISLYFLFSLPCSIFS